MSAILPLSIRAAVFPSGLTLQSLAFALAAGLIAMAARAAMEPLLGSGLTFVFAFPAIVLVALRHGPTPGFLTVAVCAIWAAVPFLPPTVAPELMPFEIGVFAVAAIVVALMCGQFRHREDLTADDAMPGVDSALARWLRAVVWGAALIPLTAFVAASWWGHQQAFEDARSAGRTANFVALRHAEQSFKVALDAIERVRALTSFPEAELQAREAEIHARLKDFGLALPPGAALAVLNAQGRLVSSGNVYPVDRTASYTDREYFQQLQKQPRLPVYVSEVFTARQARQSIFVVGRARFNASGGFDGVLIATMSPSHFQDYYKNLLPQDSLNSFVLFRNDGAVLTRWPAPPQDTPRLSPASPLFAKILAGEPSGSHLVKSTFDGERRLLTFQRAPELPLYVVAGLSESGILANWYRFVQWLAAILLPVTAALVYVAWLALQRALRHEAVWQQLQAEQERRAQAELALVQAQKLEALGHLTGGVAHDFNNLLAVISNNAYLLKRLVADPAAAGPVAAISRATTSGVKLTQQLLSFARKRELKPQILNLQHWLPAAGDLVRTSVGSRIATTIDVDPDTAPILVDPSELEVALINLAVNAKHAMPDGGTLRLSAGNVVDAGSGPGDAPMVALRVTDSGNGIAPELLSRVFDPFFTTKAPGVGSGLGLSQVYGLCLESGGKATVHSEPGQGTTVTMLFPAKAAFAPDAASAPTGPASRLDARVLLVEDNDELAAAQTAYLRSAGVAVERARQCDVALEMAARPDSDFDAVLSDIVTPGSLDGVDLALRLRTSKPGLPVLLMTGYSTRVKEAVAAGIVVLSKPVDPEALLGELAKALAAAKAR